MQLIQVFPELSSETELKPNPQLSLANGSLARQPSIQYEEFHE